MKDFAEWCRDKGVAEILGDGTVRWTEAIKPPTSGTHKDPVKGGSKISRSEKRSNKVRNGEDDLSDDYKGNYSHMGTVWPFKVVTKNK
jgi:hypothetical protein